MAASARHTTGHPWPAKLYVTLSAADTGPESPAHSYFHHRYRTLAAEVTRDFEEQQRTGGIRTDEPAGRTPGQDALAVLDGLQIQWMHDPTVDFAAIAETFTWMLAPAAESGPRAKPATG
ncbi:hypothetical protein [Streptomyces sp. NPDC020747]|uniref:hypothetical protein n=1 Tax=Streptomyces sp. NPDC020747 TaxID=3365086 RepID=UPI003790A146